MLRIHEGRRQENAVQIITSTKLMKYGSSYGSKKWL